MVTLTRFVVNSSVVSETVTVPQPSEPTTYTKCLGIVVCLSLTFLLYSLFCHNNRKRSLN